MWSKKGTLRAGAHHIKPPQDLNITKKGVITTSLEEYSEPVYCVTNDCCFRDAPIQEKMVLGANVCDFIFMSFTAPDQDDQLLANCIINDGRPNSSGLQVPLKTNWNLKLFSSLCTSQSDREVLKFLKFSWPLNRTEGPVTQTLMNHSSAEKFPEQVSTHIQKEWKHGTLMGPLISSPFHPGITGISLMLTCPKKDSD